jgi:hypothetical protein
MVIDDKGCHFYRWDGWEGAAEEDYYCIENS